MTPLGGNKAMGRCRFLRQSQSQKKLVYMSLSPLRPCAPFFSRIQMINSIIAHPQTPRRGSTR
jgi:hypothetical protein